jgi:hypothetical protein
MAARAADEPQGDASAGAVSDERPSDDARPDDARAQGDARLERHLVVRRHERSAAPVGIPRVHVTPPTVGPAYPADVVRRVLRTKIPALRTCYQALETLNSDARGRGELRFTIGTDGEVVEASLQLGFDEPEFVACVLSEIRSLKFPTPHGGGLLEITYPLVFIPDGEPTAADLAR